MVRSNASREAVEYKAAAGLFSCSVVDVQIGFIAVNWISPRKYRYYDYNYLRYFKGFVQVFPEKRSI